MNEHWSLQISNNFIHQPPKIISRISTTCLKMFHRNEEPTSTIHLSWKRNDEPALGSLTTKSTTFSSATATLYVDQCSATPMPLPRSSLETGAPRLTTQPRGRWRGWSRHWQLLPHLSHVTRRERPKLLRFVHCFSHLHERVWKTFQFISIYPQK